MSTQGKIVVAAIGVVLAAIVAVLWLSSDTTSPTPDSIAGTQPLGVNPAQVATAETKESETEAPVADPENAAESPQQTATPTASDETPDQGSNDLSEIQSALDEIFRAASTGDKAIAEAVTVQGETVAEQALELNAILTDAGEIIVDIYADPANALAVSEPVTVQDGANEIKGYLVFGLVRQDERWLIYDIDFESYETGVEEVDFFLEKHPDAVQLNP